MKESNDTFPDFWKKSSHLDETPGKEATAMWNSGQKGKE